MIWDSGLFGILLVIDDTVTTDLTLAFLDLKTIWPQLLILYILMIPSFRTERSGQTVLTQISSLIRVYTACQIERSGQTTVNSQQSGQDLHCLTDREVWANNS